MGIRKIGTNLWRIDASIRSLGKHVRKRVSIEGTKAKAEMRYLELKNELRLLNSVPQQNLWVSSGSGKSPN